MTRLVKVTYEAKEESVCAEARGTGYLGVALGPCRSGASGKFWGTIEATTGGA